MLKFLFVIVIACYAPFLQAKNTQSIPTINILTWWSYLGSPGIIQGAEDACNVKISFDEYYSNDEFIRRMQSQGDFYDIVIFSEAIYNVIKNKIPQISSDLYHQSRFYHPVIKEYYKKRNYPSNVVYFMHSLTGFLWNPKNISITSKDSINSIFGKASGKYVVIMDDAIEALKLISMGLRSGKNVVNDVSIDDFKSLIKNASIYITNNYSKIYKQRSFAFSYSWSGEAIVDLMESDQAYQFLIHPRLSYVTSDLLAQTSSNKKSLCVAKYLTSKKAAVYFQNHNFYFSPYMQLKNIQNESYKKIYINFVSMLPSLSWIELKNEQTFYGLNQSWQLIKLSLNKSVRGNK